MRDDVSGGRAPGAAAPCAACKLLRRRCAAGCVFAPYFPPAEPHKFANVHKVFGASNVSKLLQVRSSSLAPLSSLLAPASGFSCTCSSFIHVLCQGRKIFHDQRFRFSLSFPFLDQSVGESAACSLGVWTVRLLLAGRPCPCLRWNAPIFLCCVSNGERFF
jgi:hypothetical protein